MSTFYFNYHGKSYHAKASITNNNGKVNCELTSILNSQSLEPVKLAGFIPGLLSLSNFPLMEAINKGLSEYLKNYPLDRK